MPASNSGKFEIGRGSKEVQAWTPKVIRMSEETRQAFAELAMVRSWDDLRDLCEQQRIKRERGR